MTREEAESRISDLAWQMRDVILEYNPNETFFTLLISQRVGNLEFEWLGYWNDDSTLEVHCPIPSEKMVRYRESLKEEKHEA